MEPADEAAALALVQQAQAEVRLASPRERALIDALARRYSGRTADRAANDRAYAEAMRAVHRRFPRDLDIAMLYVESMMDLRPWNYWMPDGRPHAGTADIVALTEDVLRRDPAHPAALHLLIHLVEPTATPERAERAADTILTLMPAAGHMIHMASHIYQRVGRYADAIRSNQLAVDADETLSGALPRARLLSDVVLPAQHPLPVVRRVTRRPGRPRHGRRPPRRRAHHRRRPGAHALHRGVPRRAVLDQRAVRPMGGDPRRAAAAGVERVPDRRVALRARHRAGGDRPARCRRRRARGARGADAQSRARSAAVLAQQRTRHHGDRSGDARRRDRGGARRVRRRHRAPRSRGAAGGRARLHRAGRVGVPDAARARRGAARSGPCRRGRDGLLGGPAPQSRERLGADRARPGAARAGQAGGRRDRRRAAACRARPRRRGAAGLALRPATGGARTASRRRPRPRLLAGARHHRLAGRARERRDARIRRARAARRPAGHPAARRHRLVAIVRAADAAPARRRPPAGGDAARPRRIRAGPTTTATPRSPATSPDSWTRWACAAR